MGDGIRARIDRQPGGDLRASSPPATRQRLRDPETAAHRPVRQGTQVHIGGRVVYAAIVHHPGTAANLWRQPYAPSNRRKDLASGRRTVPTMKVQPHRNRSFFQIGGVRETAA
jgi:hypothetical protein